MAFGEHEMVKSGVFFCYFFVSSFLLGMNDIMLMSCVIVLCCVFEVCMESASGCGGMVISLIY